MNKLLTGYHETVINPPLGIGISGYYVPRFAKGILDDIKASVFVLSCDDETVAIISIVLKCLPLLLIHLQFFSFHRSDFLSLPNAAG